MASGLLHRRHAKMKPKMLKNRIPSFYFLNESVTGCGNSPCNRGNAGWALTSHVQELWNDPGGWQWPVGLLCLFMMVLAASLAAPPAFAEVAALEERDIVFYYGSRPPVEDLRHFDHIVVQPSQILPHEKTALLNLNSLVFAYVSFGEIARNSEDMARIKTKWSIGVNPAWNSLVMDMTSPDWHQYLMEHHFDRLWREGYRAFFLDTVDRLSHRND
jgi:hypothetical protein